MEIFIRTFFWKKQKFPLQLEKDALIHATERITSVKSTKFITSKKKCKLE